jgi:hypothetical protein
MIDADAELRRRLVELREAVAGRINDAAESIDAVRAALIATFESVDVHYHQDGEWAGQVWLLPFLRQEAFQPITFDPKSGCYGEAYPRQIPLVFRAEQSSVKRG